MLELSIRFNATFSSAGSEADRGCVMSASDSGTDTSISASGVITRDAALSCPIPRAFRGPPAELELSLHFRGSPQGALAARSTLAAPRAPGSMSSAAASIRYEATPAKEFAVYTYRSDVAVSGSAGPLRASVALYTVPSYRGAWGFARRLGSNVHALWLTVGGPPWAYLQAVASALLPSAAVPVVVLVLVLQVGWRWIMGGQAGDMWGG